MNIARHVATLFLFSLFPFPSLPRLRPSSLTLIHKPLPLRTAPRILERGETGIEE